MTSEAMRDQEEDHLLTPRNAALLIIDYQPVQVGSIASMDRRTLVTNIVAVARTAKLYELPIVLSTVNVNTGANQPTVHQLADVLDGMKALDRTTINAWEDEEFVNAVRTAGRKKLLMTALWTEACLTFPTFDAIREGYEVYPIVDAVGGTSVEAHRAALERIVQAGAKPTSWGTGAVRAPARLVAEGDRIAVRGHSICGRRTIERDWGSCLGDMTDTRYLRYPQQQAAAKTGWRSDAAAMPPTWP
jgi:nicotinamidase-related amidase